MKMDCGSTFVRVDLHSHTKEDKEFTNQNWQNNEEFAKSYVDKLEQQSIKIVAITNHNKFVRDEYLVIKKKALVKGILVLPGVEISISDGKSGMHLLCIFQEEAVNVDKFETQCQIEKFIANMFPDRRFDDGGDPIKSDKNLKEMVKILETMFSIKYMLIPAHVDNSKGCFKEWNFTSIRPLISQDWMRKRIMAFQGIGYSSRKKYENEVHMITTKLGIPDKLLIPAYIEASDPKCIEEVGRKYSYIKLGELSFEALFFALSQPELRVMGSNIDIGQPVPYIRNIRFLTQKGLENVNVSLNPSLNNLIGIRGSGKSTIIEAIRYAFELEAEDDKEYKNSLIKEHLGSGGKIEVEIQDKVGNKYILERVYDQSAKIYRDGEFLTGLRPTDLVPMVYYGQKDLQRRMKEPKLQMEFVDQYIKEDLNSIQNKINEKVEEIKSLFYEIKRLREKVEKKKEFEEKLAKVNKEINDFIRLKIADKLKLEAAFKKDEMFFRKVQNVIAEAGKLNSQYFNDHTTITDSISFIKSENNQDLVDELETAYNIYKKQLAEILAKIGQSHDEMKKVFIETGKKFKQRQEGIAENIAEIKRSINTREVSVDDYSKKIEEKEKYKIALNQISEYETKLITLETRKTELIQGLQELWYKLYRLRVEKAEQINESQNIIRIEIQYKSETETYCNWLKEILKGTGIRSDKIQQLSEYAIDGVALLEKFASEDETIAKPTFLNESQIVKIKECLFENESLLSTFKVPDTIKILYQGKPLEQLSLGQRSSSLLMLLLNLDNHPLIMDQPEDDLDNQMIYSGLVRELLELKGKRQIVFATHNSNIPVLGDCDQGIVCINEATKIKVNTGSIDTDFLQKSIVQIMEGGKEAFDKRKEIYEKWTF